MQRTIGPLIIRTLNEMLEEERAAVEAVIGLTSMATDPNERDVLQRIGGDEVWSCSGLRARIETLGGVPSLHISDFANYVLSLEYFPERLRTYGRHQRLIMERITTLLAQAGLDDETRTFLEEMRTQHETDIVWCENRANLFEASRYNGEAPPPRPAPQPYQPSMRPMGNDRHIPMNNGVRSPNGSMSNGQQSRTPIADGNRQVPNTNGFRSTTPVTPTIITTTNNQSVPPTPQQPPFSYQSQPVNPSFAPSTRVPTPPVRPTQAPVVVPQPSAPQTTSANSIPVPQSTQPSGSSQPTVLPINESIIAQQPAEAPVKKPRITRTTARPKATAQPPVEAPAPEPVAEQAEAKPKRVTRRKVTVTTESTPTTNEN